MTEQPLLLVCTRRNLLHIVSGVSEHVIKHCCVVIDQLFYARVVRGGSSWM